MELLHGPDGPQVVYLDVLAVSVQERPTELNFILESVVLDEGREG